RLRFSGPKTSIICSPMTSLKTSIKTITYLSDIGCLEIQGASLVLLLNIPSGGVMMLSGLLPGGRWFAQLCVLLLTVIGAVLYLP
ncbi:hypothetical protein, partial [Salmonella enterica]|uniref:hypothetical protein n=1 Tax=Salmonella enterica TaxID=28901 RepID=UPI003D6D9E42